MNTAWQGCRMLNLGQRWSLALILDNLASFIWWVASLAITFVLVSWRFLRLQRTGLVVLRLELLLSHHLRLDQLVVTSVRLCACVPCLHLWFLFLLFFWFFRHNLLRRWWLRSLNRWGISRHICILPFQILARALSSEFNLRLYVVLVILFSLLQLLVLLDLLLESRIDDRQLLHKFFSLHVVLTRRGLTAWRWVTVLSK